jgi:N-acetylated-alpha-linked acidic dipeptidase
MTENRAYTWGRKKEKSTPDGRFVCVILIALFCVFGAAGQDARDRPGGPVRGFSETQMKDQWAWEQKMRAIPQPTLLHEYMEFLADAPHALGSAKGKINAEWMVDKFKSWGLETAIEQFQVLSPVPKERVVELIEPERYVARLKEPAVLQDSDTTDEGQLPTFNAFSADGDVTAQVVYANYGLPSDYATLKTMGIDVKGKIVLVRYGASWRGIKPKVAYENGAAACLIFSDPKDDGYYQGAVYPEGPFRPEHGVQRGSVVDMPIYPGDPLTPGVGATADAKRLSLAEATTLMKIPVMPISWGDALPILKNMRGSVAPESWRGALPTTYFIGPGPAVVHVKLSSEWSLRTAYDVVARIPGSVYPDEWIIRGNHHDAWVNGASDPVSGLVILLEEARALGELLKQGWRPKRTIVFAAWDGEEEGLLGSTEWAEQHAAELQDKAVAYINTDSNGRGWYSASGSHTLERFMHEVAQDIADPFSGGNVYDAAIDHEARNAGQDAPKGTVRTDQRIGALGSGSDYTVFIDHLGIPSLNVGFGGADGGGIYHSIYDTLYYVTHFSDSTCVYGRALAQLDGTAMMRLADAAVLPFEFSNLADTVGVYVGELESLAPKGKADLAALRSSQQALVRSAAAYEQAYNRAASKDLFERDPARRAALNKLLFQSERVLLSNDGLPRRPWYRHLLYAPGFYTGYGVKTIPFVREALEQDHWDEAAKGTEVVGQKLLALARHLDAAAKLLGAAPAP